MKKIVTLLIFLICVTHGMFAARSAADKQQARDLLAERCREAVKIDGVLNEAVWQGPGVEGFVQLEPDEGEPATERTQVWVAFDDKALYVAARMHDREPEGIVRLLGRRDDQVDSDWFVVSIDPYNDKRSGFQFGVNPAGSILDRTLSNDAWRDSTWDGVWESAARVDEKGWSVEMRIPFHQLRFRRQDEYTWGIYFQRKLQRRNEWAGLTWIPRKEDVFVSRFSCLKGISGINPGRHIEILPYLVGKAGYTPGEAGNPFDTGSAYLGNMGLDAKIGLLSNLTLDLTVNPDFGQVEVDPALINLSANESYYSEKRPFFIEGSSIFDFGSGGATSHIGADWGNPRFFYSRRIGRPPVGRVSSEGYVDIPDAATILGAAKLTGKPGRGWNIGMISAFTQREYADIDLYGARESAEVEPFAYYGVFRALKEFDSGRQGLGFMGTLVSRDLNDPGLERQMPGGASSFGLDGWWFLDREKVWVLSGWWGTSRVTGTAAQIADLQLGFPHYFGRPDADHVSFDPDATSLTGWAGRVELNKEKGNFLFNAAMGAISPGFDVRDAGFQYTADVINAHVMAGYRSYKPGKVVRNWNLLLFTQRNYNFDGMKTGEQRLIAITNVTLKNYWSLYGQFSHNPGHWQNDETRGGVVIRCPAFNWFDFGVDSDSRRKLVVGAGGYLRWGPDVSRQRQGYVSLRWKPSTNVSLQITPQYSFGRVGAQWVANIDDPAMIATAGIRSLFGDLYQHTITFPLRLNWVFTPRLSLQAYIQPFMAVGEYRGFKELARSRSFDFNHYGEGDATIVAGDGGYTLDPDGPGPVDPFRIDNPDFNFKSLRGTVVLRWEYRPGSVIYLVWTQNRADYSDPGDLSFGRDLGNLLSARGDNIFMLKATYRFKL